MTFEIVYGETGRGAWPAKTGRGGTLNSSGTGPGPYYRKRRWGSSAKLVGKVGADAVKNQQPVSIDYYAVYKAVQTIQRWLGAEADGVYGRETKNVVKQWQSEMNLKADGVFGPTAARALFEPVILREASKADPGSAVLGPIVVGHISWESGFDPGAVGGVSPHDLGLCQINGIAHPDMSVDKRLTSLPSIKWAVDFVKSNLDEFPNNLDAGIAAYNLGKGGARSWVRAGSPDVWERDGKTTDVRRYVDEIKSRAGLI